MIRAAKIAVYARLMKRMGISTQQLLSDTDVDPTLLGDPQGRVTREQYYDVILNMIRITGNPGIALSLGEVVEISMFGILGYAMLSSTTLGQVIRIRRQFHHDTFGSVVSINSAKDVGSGYELTISSTALTEALRRFEIEEFLVEGLTVVKLLTGIDPEIRSLSFAFSPPSYRAAYADYFKCPIQFNATQTSLSLREPGFDTPVLSGNSELHTVCSRHCQQVMQSACDSGQLRDRLRELFLANPSLLPDLREAAQSLGISERNLGRKLSSEGLTYQALKDRFRLDLSRQLLVSGNLAQKEVAHLLGFTTPSAFSRAFKSWTGRTVQEFVRSH
jgi:AraC-like DNA-binding protein